MLKKNNIMKTGKTQTVKREWVKTKNPLFADYLVVVGGDTKKIFDSLVDAKKYAEKLKTKKSISITEKIYHNFIELK